MVDLFGEEYSPSRGAKMVDGRYFTFRLGEEIFGISILKVQETLSVNTLKQVANLPKYFSGITTLRGQPIPVIDLRLKFGLESRTANNSPFSLIVVQLSTPIIFGKKSESALALAIDEETDMVNILNGQIELKSIRGQNRNGTLLFGIARIQQKVIRLLNIDQIISLEDWAILLNLEMVTE